MNNTISHQKLCDDILFGVGQLLGARGRIFPRRVGLATPIGSNRPVYFGMKGEADLQGWVKIKRFAYKGVKTINEFPFKSGTFAASFAIEVKTGTGKLTKDQERWRDVFVSCGGIYILGKNLEEVLITVKSLLT